MRRDLSLFVLLVTAELIGLRAAPQTPAAVVGGVTITEADCTLAKLGAAVPGGAIGEPVGKVAINIASWVAETPQAAAHCRVDGAIAPVDAAPEARPINYRVLLPASWN